MVAPIPVDLPPGVPAGLAVWHLPLDLDRDHPEDLAILTDGERVRAARYYHAADRRRYVLARAGMRRLLGNALGIAAADVPLFAGPQGKPELRGAKAPACNLSHAGSHAYLALADSSVAAAIGIDIERCLPSGPLPQWLSLACDEEEADAICRADDPPAALIIHWTAKEAVLKALGTGIAEHLARIRIAAGPRAALALHTTLPAAQAMHACRLPAPAGYAAALAWLGTGD